MFSIRIKFLRGDDVKYISHLDLMKVFERAIRRAGLPVAYSQGFNPHPQMVFGLPLAVGVTSEAEYADFDLAESMNLQEFLERINGQLPETLKVMDAKAKLSGGNIMATVSSAVYEIDVMNGSGSGKNDMEKAVASFMARESVLVRKETKNGSRDVDIRPMVYQLEVCGQDTGSSDVVRLITWLSAGSKSNLKPELLVSALEDLIGKDLKTIRIHRKELYVEQGGKMVNPLDPAVLCP